MKLVFNPLTGKLDYVRSASDPFPVAGIYMYSTSYLWSITVDDAGTLTATRVTDPMLDFSDASNSMYLSAI